MCSEARASASKHKREEGKASKIRLILAKAMLILVVLNASSNTCKSSRCWLKLRVKSHSHNQYYDVLCRLRNCRNKKLHMYCSKALTVGMRRINTRTASHQSFFQHWQPHRQPRRKGTTAHEMIQVKLIVPPRHQTCCFRRAPLRSRRLTSSVSKTH